jgi:23S rRNA (pseudouridine1915-N3)-methyltransferase
VDKTREKYFEAAAEEYLKRLQRYVNLEVVIVKGEKLAGGKPDAQIISAEAARIRAQFEKNEFRVALDRRGDQFTSDEFAEFFSTLMNRGISQMGFIIGGPLGLPETLLRECEKTLSFSKMTFTHEMSRVILLEQIYRAFTILNHEKYHK